MEKINEVQILTNVRLSHAQKFILSKLMLPEKTPLTSFEQVSTGRNILSNRDILIKLGMLIVGENEAEITEKGKEALRNENLIDDMDNLTDQGEQYAYAKDLAEVERLAAQEKEPEMPDLNHKQSEIEEPKPIGNTAQDQQAAGPFEQWSMINDAQSILKESEFLEEYSIKPKKS